MKRTVCTRAIRRQSYLDEGGNLHMRYTARTRSIA